MKFFSAKLGLFPILFGCSLVIALGGTSCHDGKPIEEQPLISDQGVLIPAGQALAHPLQLEAGVVLTGGAWIHDGSDSFGSDNFSYEAPTTLDGSLELPAGSIFIGDVIIPSDVSLQPGSILPGARTLDLSGAAMGGAGGMGGTDFSLATAAIVVPPNEPLVADQNAVPPSSLMTGALPFLETDLTVPAGTNFPNGYKSPDEEIFSNELPDAFPDYEVSEETTFATGTLLLGGLELPDGAGITIDSDNNSFVGSYRLPEDGVIPAPGIGLPAGTRLDAALLIPRGASFLVESTLPASTELGLGYVEPPQEDPPELNYTAGSTLGDNVTVPAGTALLGDALIPEGIGQLGADLFLPGGTQVGRGLSLPEQEELGMSIPPTATLSTATFNPSNLPPRTLLTGYDQPTQDDIVVPVGAEFLGGYQLPDGEIVQASPVESETTIPAGSILFGGVALPSESSGNFLTFTSDLTLPGAAMIPSTADGDANTQGPEGLTIPVNSLSVSGTTGSDPQDLDRGTTLTEAIDMPSGALYCKAADITDATGFAKITTAKIEYVIDGEAPTQIDVATDFQFNDIVETFEPSTTTGLVEQDVTGLSPNTTYYFRVSVAGCQTTNVVIQGFRTTDDPCGGDFELVGVGDVYDGWDGRFGTADESALHVSQMKVNPLDNRLYIAASKQSDGTANLYRSSLDFLGIEEAGLVVGNMAVRNSTTIGFQNFTDDYVYLAFKDNANRGFSLYRWELGMFGTDISIASGEGMLGGINAADREGFGSDGHRWVTDSIGAELGVNGVMYIATRGNSGGTTAEGGVLFVADGDGTATDFTNCGMCSLNNGEGAIWDASDDVAGVDNVGTLAYVDATSTSGMFVGFGEEGGTSAGLAFLATGDLGTTTAPTVLTIADLSAEVVTDIAVLNNDIVASFAASGGGQAWRCADYENNDCSNGGNWSKWVDFADGTGLSSAASGNTALRWVRQMPNSGAVYLGTENSGGAEIWSAANLTTNLSREPQNGCGGLGNSSLIASPTAATMHNSTRNVDILYFAFHQYALYDQADEAMNNVYVYRLLEQL